MKEYTIVKEDDTYSLELRINHYLQSGWILAGGVSVVPNKDKYVYVQAIVKP